jgi:hypothetical protein
MQGWLRRRQRINALLPSIILMTFLVVALLGLFRGTITVLWNARYHPL